MSSRFFKTLSDSESESSDGEAEVLPQRQAGAAIGAGYSFSDDEEDVKRQVKSAKDKHSEQLRDLIKSMRNGKKIKDFTKILPDFEELIRRYAKVKTTISDKDSDGKIPRFMLRWLVELEDFTENLWSDRAARKNMNKNNSKAFSSLRQKLRKYIKTIQEEYDEFRASAPADSSDADESGASDSDASGAGGDGVSDAGSDSASEAGETPAQATQAAKQAVKAAKDDDDDSSDWGDSDDDSDLSSDDEKYADNPAARFLKSRTTQKQQEDKDKEAQIKRTKKSKTATSASAGARKRADEDDEDRGWEQVRGAGSAGAAGAGAGAIGPERPKMFAQESEITHANVLKKLVEVLAMRGKKRVDRSDQTDMLVELLTLSRDYKLGPAIELRIILGIVASLFEYNPNVSDCLKLSVWEEVLKYLALLMDTLIQHPEVEVSDSIDEDNESYEAEPYKIGGCPIALTERMDEEFNKLLQNCDAHSREYVERLKHERTVCNIIERLQEYYESLPEKASRQVEPSYLIRVYLLRIDHIYYKFDIENIKKSDETQSKSGAVKKVTTAELMDGLCKYIYKHDSANLSVSGTTKSTIVRAILSHIYFHALHDNYFEARDLMLMSHLQGNMGKAEIPLQIMYNRALVQLGLCAFRQGFIADAHAALLDVQVLGKAREFLAQGLPMRHQERTPEQEKLERRRQVPFHKHINLDLLECVYLVSSMLLEIPDVAANEYSVRKKMISRLFYNQLRKSEEQPIVGLPETTREHVVAASKAMRVGNWKACRDLIINDKVNMKVWNLFHQADKVRSMLERKIREGSLRAYLFTYSNVYDSIAMDVLAQMFDLEKSTVHSIVSKMIINEELMASLDEPTQSVVMHRTEPSRLQGLALQMVEKINYLVDQNARVWDAKQSVSGGGGLGGAGGSDRRNFGGSDHRHQYKRNDRSNRRGGNSDRTGNQDRSVHIAVNDD